MLVDDVRKHQNPLPSLKSLTTDQTYWKTPRGHLSESSSGIILEEKAQYSQKLPKSVVQEEGLENVRQAEFTGSTDEPNQHLKSHSLFQKQIEDSDDISIPEIDDNVKKADIFSKELKYMCNMLQKKHEEAKDILVRSIVTNNLLLMLNHPLHEEKIQKIKMYAVSMLPNNAQDGQIK
ncbi:uncharacterized protein LOC131071931 [Cryptomeria japonica]|uniref:uncharacterized protein LOC131071931 n=1 Tax=Cryptomeria japonica TaxID=3369 RepID=UPI0025AC7ED9|nr:uncharacterized protein LOC131071931 [Cryptomeria japonica]